LPGACECLANCLHFKKIDSEHFQLGNQLPA
jgi:hypothetical protein